MQGHVGGIGIDPENFLLNRRGLVGDQGVEAVLLTT